MNDNLQPRVPTAALHAKSDAGVQISSQADYALRKQALLSAIAARGGRIRLNKKTSNLFRHRKANPVDNPEAAAQLSDFKRVLEVNPDEGYVLAEGMTSFADLVAITLQYGYMPAVVPELKTITLGGALAGVGIESSSFRYGLVHESVLEFEVLLPGGRVVTCSPDNEHADLFFAFANSYGTLGYALQVKVKIVKVTPYVELEHIHCKDAQSFYQQLAAYCQSAAKLPDGVISSGEIAFIDATIFAPDNLVITLGRGCDKAPYHSDYTDKHIFYRSIASRDQDYLSIGDYIWRWDTDWFWCSKVFGAQQPWLRWLFGKKRLNSAFYNQVMRWAKRSRFMDFVQRWLLPRTESVIQDVCIPIEHASEFLEFFQREIGITPIWNCPVAAYKPERQFSMFPYQTDKLHINFGFWDMVPSKMPAGHFNRLVEQKVVACGGMKSLYSSAFYSKEEFWEIFPQAKYQELKARYDSEGQLGDVYTKCTEQV